MLPLGFLGLPALHSIVEAVAGGFLTALAGALVPGFLRHATVGTIQQLVALSDPAGWGHVRRLQERCVPRRDAAAGHARRGDTAVLAGRPERQRAPTVAVTRCVWVTGVLVAYRWIVEQAVAAANTFTHAILGLPAVGDGLARLVTALFGRALLTGAGGRRARACERKRARFQLLSETGRLCGYRAATIQALDYGAGVGALTEQTRAHLAARPACAATRRTRASQTAGIGVLAALLTAAVPAALRWLRRLAGTGGIAAKASAVALTAAVLAGSALNAASHRPGETTQPHRALAPSRRGDASRRRLRGRPWSRAG